MGAVREYVVRADRWLIRFVDFMNAQHDRIGAFQANWSDCTWLQRGDRWSQRRLHDFGLGDRWDGVSADHHARRNGQRIIAEAALQTDDRTTAATAFNNVRVRHSKSTITAAALTLSDVMTEKYITLFENPEVWNDYKRTCLPALKPAQGRSRIPGRLFYGQTETQTNKAENVPAENLFNIRNPNDPNACL